MKRHQGIAELILALGLLLSASSCFAQDPNFHIYIAFGQSNMEGMGLISNADKVVDSRFKVLESLTCSNLNRTKGSWYTAVPPLCRCNTGFSPLDNFGRTMVDSLPASIKVGVVNVSVAGCQIGLFDKVNYASYTATWMASALSDYNQNPYARLVEMALLAKKDGVIKGILMHQGESNIGDAQWPAKVKAVYNNLINDLGLDPTKVPFLVGQVVDSEQSGVYAGANSLVNQIPSVIPNSYVISSKGCTDTTDNTHFNNAGYKELGRRYAVKMLSLLGDVTPVPQVTQTVWLESECATVGSNWDRVSDATASNGNYVSVKTGLNSLTTAPTGSSDVVSFPFSVDSAGTYNVFARVNCATADDDSYWIKMDNGAFVSINSLMTTGWQWLTLTTFTLTPGAHTLTIAYREDGAKLDKISISNSSTLPTDMGGAVTCNIPVDAFSLNTQTQFSLSPYEGKGLISFELPEQAFASLKILTMQGKEVAELGGRVFPAGKHTVGFPYEKLPLGAYMVSLKSDHYSASRLMFR